MVSPRKDRDSPEKISDARPQVWVDLPGRSSPLIPRNTVFTGESTTSLSPIGDSSRLPRQKSAATLSPSSGMDQVGGEPLPQLSSPAFKRSMDLQRMSLEKMPNSISSPRASLYSPRTPRPSNTSSGKRLPKLSIEMRSRSNESFVSALTQEGTRGHDLDSFDVGRWTVREDRSQNNLTLVQSEPIRGADPVPQTLPPYGGFQIETPQEMFKAVQQIGSFLEKRGKSGLEVSKSKSLRFWLMFMGIAITGFLSATDMTIIAPMLPTIARDLPASDISPTWITSAFLITMTSFQPAWGGVSDAVGRRAALVASLVIFMAGSIPCVVAHSMLVLVIGRGIQGIGGGGMLAVGEIMLSDITTLAERGYFLGLLSFAFAAAAVAAPLVGGVFADAGGLGWRWAFIINFPIGAVALAFAVSTKLRVPKLSLREKLDRCDLPSSLILFGSTTSLLIGLTRGGTSYSWSETGVAIPIGLGSAGILAYLGLQWIPNPIVPRPVLAWELFCANRTALIAYILTFLHGVMLYGAVQNLILYFETRDASPLSAAIDVLPANAPSTPAAFVAGVAMALTGRYKGLIIASQLFMLVGFGMFVYLDTSSPTYQWAIFQVIASFGIGAMYTLALPPIQASVPANYLARATATFAFLRALGAVWGVSATLIAFSSTAGDELQHVAGSADVGVTGATAIASTTLVKDLPIDVREDIRRALGQSIRVAFSVLVPFAGIGFFLSFFIKHIPLPNFNNSEYSMEHRQLPDETYDLESSAKKSERQDRATNSSGDDSSRVQGLDSGYLATPSKASLRRSSSFWR